jgi:hypothetical protein
LRGNLEGIVERVDIRVIHCEKILMFHKTLEKCKTRDMFSKFLELIQNSLKLLKFWKIFENLNYRNSRILLMILKFAINFFINSRNSCKTSLLV